MRKKRGFATPMDRWLQEGLGNSTKKLLRSKESASRDYFDINYVDYMIDQHTRKRQNYQKHLFAILSFEIWYRTFFKNMPVEAIAN